MHRGHAAWVYPRATFARPFIVHAALLAFVRVLGGPTAVTWERRDSHGQRKGAPSGQGLVSGSQVLSAGTVLAPQSPAHSSQARVPGQHLDSQAATSAKHWFPTAASIPVCAHPGTRLSHSGTCPCSCTLHLRTNPGFV